MGTFGAGECVLGAVGAKVGRCHDRVEQRASAALGYDTGRRSMFALASMFQFFSKGPSSKIMRTQGSHMGK